MELKNILIMIFVILGVVSLGLTTALFSVSDTGGLTADDIKYPSPTDKIFMQTYAHLECTYTDGAIRHDDWFALEKESDNIYYRYITCPEDTGRLGCEIEFSGTCNQGSIIKNYALKPIKGTCGFLGDCEVETNLHIEAGNTRKFRVTCLGDYAGAWTINPPINPQYAVDYYPKKLKLLSADPTVKTGFIAGTNNCYLVSTFSEKIKELQTKDEPFLKGAEQIPFGAPFEQVTFIAGWVERPAYGNLINYNGGINNAVCKPFDGLYEAPIVQTVGGNNYHVLGNPIKTYTQTNDFCCNNDNCAGDTVCEDYKCTDKPEVCEFGECTKYQVDRVIDTKCEQKGNDFFLTTEKCEKVGDSYCIVPDKKDVNCCRDYCDGMSTFSNPLYCDYTKGCESIKVKKECPDGMCCADSDYKEQDCASNLDCCWNEVPTDPNLGICRSSCSASPVEVCDNGIDDDGDNKIDCEDIDCANSVYCGGDEPVPFNWGRFIIIMIISFIGALILTVIVGSYTKSIIHNKKLRIGLLIILFLISFVVIFFVTAWIIKLIIIFFGLINRLVM